MPVNIVNVIRWYTNYLQLDKKIKYKINIGGD